jgi:hypothetical protein
VFDVDAVGRPQVDDDGTVVSAGPPPRHTAVPRTGAGRGSLSQCAPPRVGDPAHDDEDSVDHRPPGSQAAGAEGDDDLNHGDVAAAEIEAANGEGGEQALQ